MSTILSRLESLERRVASLEAHRAGVLDEPAPEALPPAPRALAAEPATTAPTPAPEPLVAPPEPPAPAAPAPGVHAAPPAATPEPWPRPVRAAAGRASRPAAPARDLEAWVGGVLLGRVGIGAVVLAAAYFAQLAYRHVSDAGKVLSLYLLAGALIGAGRLLRSRAGGRYVATLWGGAVAVAYVAGLAATLRYGLVDPWTGLGLLAAASLLGHLLSRVLRNETLAAVSVVSGYVSPFLLGVVQSQGPWILGYAAAVHAAAAWSERTWGWRAARGAALLGSALVAWVWAFAQGGGPAATFLALHALALLLLAPDLVGAWWGRVQAKGIDVGCAAGLALLATALVVSEAWGGRAGVLRGATLMAGGAWLGLATALAWRARPGSPQLLVRALGVVGGLLATFGVVLVWRTQVLPLGPLLGLALLSGGLLALRRLTTVGDAAVAVASVLALGIAAERAEWVAGVPAGLATAGYAWLLLLPALVPAALLLVAGRAVGVRVLGLLAGAATLGASLLAPAVELNAGWGALALVLPAAWTLAAHERARQAADRPVAIAAGVLGLALAGLWGFTCFRLGRPAGWEGALDPHTWSALALAGALFALRSLTLSRRGPGDYRPVAMAGIVGLVLLAGGREVDLLTRHLAPSAHHVALALFAAASGLALALHARTGERLGRAKTAIVGLAASALGLAAQGLAHPLDGALLLGLLGSGVATALGGAVLRERRGARPGWLDLSIAPFAVLAATWLLGALGRPATFHPALWNLRFAGGAGLLALLSLSTWRAVRAGATPVVRWSLGIAALGVGWLAGLFELVEATRGLAGAWAAVLVSLYTALVAGGLLAVGFAWNLYGLRYAALTVLGCVALKVGLYDLAASELPLRVLVTGVLGLVLLGSAYAYARRRRAVEAAPPGPPGDAPPRP